MLVSLHPIILFSRIYHSFNEQMLYENNFNLSYHTVHFPIYLILYMMCGFLILEDEDCPKGE